MKKLKTVFVIVLLLLPVLLFSQYTVEQKNNEGLYQISWRALQNVTRYVMVLQKEGGDQVEVITVNPQVELTLEIGVYRIRVTAYHPGSETAMPWSSFPATARPRIYSFYPRGIRIRERQFDLIITGKNYLPDTKLALVSRNGVSYTPLSFTVESSGKRAHAVFDMQDLPANSYTIYVTNPDGLNDSLGPFSAAERKFELTADYAPIFLAHGIFNKSLQKFFYPAGAELKLGYYFLETSSGNLGAEALLAWNFIKSENITDHPPPAVDSANFVELRFNIVYRLAIGQKSAVTFSAGGGMESILGFTFDYLNSPDKHNALVPLVALGVSYRRNINDIFYAEAGADYLLIFFGGPQGIVRPYIGAGWRF